MTKLHKGKRKSPMVLFHSKFYDECKRKGYFKTDDEGSDFFHKHEKKIMKNIRSTLKEITA